MTVAPSHWWVSSPRYTIRVDVTVTGTIAATSARYISRNYGQSWAQWLMGQQRMWRGLLRVVQLGKDKEVL